MSNSEVIESMNLISSDEDGPQNSVSSELNVALKNKDIGMRKKKKGEHLKVGSKITR